MTFYNFAKNFHWLTEQIHISSNSQQFILPYFFIIAFYIFLTLFEQNYTHFQ